MPYISRKELNALMALEAENSGLRMEIESLDKGLNTEIEKLKKRLHEYELNLSHFCEAYKELTTAFWLPFDERRAAWLRHNEIKSRPVN
jgi:hypothetical protein